MSELDLNRSTALELADRQTHLIEVIDEALSRIEDGTYGLCARWRDCRGSWDGDESWKCF